MITSNRTNITPKPGGMFAGLDKALDKTRRKKAEPVEEKQTEETETAPTTSETPVDTETVETEVTEEKVVEPTEEVKEQPQEPAQEVPAEEVEPPKETKPTEEVVEEKKEEEPSNEPTEEIKETVEEIEHTEPSIADSQAFSRLVSNSENAQPQSNDSFAEMIETMVSQQCQVSGVKNLDLVSFGIRAKTLTFKMLSVMEFGKHRFLGAPFTQEEEDIIIHRLALHVAQSDKERIVIAAVKPIDSGNNLLMYSLQFTDSIAQRFADMFDYKVYINKHEADVSKLVMIVDKK